MNDLIAFEFLSRIVEAKTRSHRLLRWCVVHLYNIYQVEIFFNQLVEKGNKSIILDLKKVNYLDSSGLGGLLKMSTDIKKYNGNMSICRLQDYPKSLVKMACLEYTFLVSDSVRESIKKLRQTR